MQSEINYTRDPLIYGNSCKVKALFNNGARPRPSFLDESSAHMYMSKAIGETKENKTSKEVKANTIKHHRENQRQTNPNTTVGPISPNADMGPEVLLVCFVVCCSSRWCFIVVALTTLVVLFCFVLFLMCSSFCIVCSSVCLDKNYITNCML